MKKKNIQEEIQQNHCPPNLQESCEVLTFGGSPKAHAMLFGFGWNTDWHGTVSM